MKSIDIFPATVAELFADPQPITESREFQNPTMSLISLTSLYRTLDELQ